MPTEPHVIDEQNLQFLYEVGAFRFVQRAWKHFLNPDFANISEHTFRLMWIALIIAQNEKNIDYEKLLKMALVHDLPESRTGDAHYLGRQYSERKEELAVDEIFAGTSLFLEFPALWREYEKRTSLEAKIVKDADNIDIDLELQEQGSKGNELVKLWHDNRKTKVYPKLFTKGGKTIWSLIRGSNPHDWHMKGRNRFTEGDWKK